MKAAERRGKRKAMGKSSRAPEKIAAEGKGQGQGKGKGKGQGQGKGKDKGKAAMKRSAAATEDDEQDHEDEDEVPRESRKRARLGKGPAACKEEEEEEEDSSAASSSRARARPSGAAGVAGAAAVRVGGLAESSIPAGKAADRSAKLELSQLLRVHGDQSRGLADETTAVYRCAFAPPVADFGAGLVDVAECLVATAGGESICFIDCEVGEVLRKYTHPGEHFYALAWTALHRGVAAVGKGAGAGVSGDNGRSLVLAAGGMQGDVKLIDFEQMVCYDQLGGNEDHLTDLVFHPSLADVLLSADISGTVIIWKIRPYGDIENAASTKLAAIDFDCWVETAAWLPSASASPAPDRICFVAGCEAGKLEAVELAAVKRQKGRKGGKGGKGQNAGHGVADDALPFEVAWSTIISTKLPHKKGLIDSIVALGYGVFGERPALSSPRLRCRRALPRSCHVTPLPCFKYRE